MLTYQLWWHRLQSCAVSHLLKHVRAQWGHGWPDRPHGDSRTVSGQHGLLMLGETAESEEKLKQARQRSPFFITVSEMRRRMLSAMVFPQTTSITSLWTSLSFLNDKINKTYKQKNILHFKTSLEPTLSVPAPHAVAAGPRLAPCDVTQSSHVSTC